MIHDTRQFNKKELWIYIIIHLVQRLIDCMMFNPSLNDKILDLSELKAFADNKINVPETMKSVCERIEKVLRKGEIAGYQHFLLFPKCFRKPHFLGLLKVGIVL